MEIQLFLQKIEGVPQIFEAEKDITCGKEAVPALINLLSSNDNKKYFLNTLSAITTIGADAKDAVPILIVLLSNSDKEVNYAAADALSSIGDAAKKAIPSLVKSIEKSNTYIFYKALAGIGGEGFDYLIEYSKKSDPAIRSNAIKALGVSRQNTSPLVMNVMAKALEDQTEGICLVATETLEAIGSAAENIIPNLIQVIKNNKSCRWSAGEALVSIGKGSVLPLAHLLQNSDDYIQFIARESLRKISYIIKQDAKDTVPFLIDVLKEDVSIYDKSEVMNILGNIGSSAKDAIPILREELIKPIDTSITYPDQPIQYSAMRALGRMGKEATTALIVLLPNDDARARARIFFTLGEIGLEANIASPYVLPFLQSQDKKQQLLAAITLARIGGGEVDTVLSILIPALQIDDLNVQARVVWAIESLGPSAISAVPELIKVIAKGGYAGKALIEIGVDSLPVLINSIGKVSIRNVIVSFGSNAIPELFLGIQNENFTIRHNSAIALAQIGEDSIPFLLKALQHNNVKVRKEATYALGIINKPSTDLVNFLGEVVANKNNDLDERRMAASTLVLMGEDESPFFKQYNFPNPLNPKCHDISGRRFDIYTGKCTKQIFSSLNGTPQAGGGDIIRALCRFFGC